MEIISATDVRKNWSLTLDSVIRERPAYIKRTRDNLALLNIDTLSYVLSGYKYSAEIFIEKDGSVTLSADYLDLVVNAKDEEQAKNALASDIKEYAEDYYEHYAVWSVSPNRRTHIPYVLKALSLDTKEIAEELVCRNGRN